MQAAHDPVAPDLSRAKSNALFIAALVAALLGLTMLDVAPVGADKVHAGPAGRSVDCIVASAVFAGANVSPTH